jgi:hypothetical protein
MTVNVSDWSETPASNTTIDGINIAENCNPNVLNNSIRSLMAGVKTFKLLYDSLATTVAGKVNASGAVFSGTQPIYTGEGAVLHHQNSANASGKVYLLPEGSSRPASPSNGDLVFFYS